MTTATADHAAEAAAARAAYDARRAADAATSAARAANGEGYREVLAQQATARTMSDRIKAAPGALRDWVRAVFETFRLDKTLGVVEDAAQWAWGRLNHVFAFARGFGLTNLAGIIATTPLRRTAVDVARTTAQVITYPIRLVGRFLRWGMNMFGPTRVVAQAVERGWNRAALSIETRVESGLQWMEKHDDHGAMTWLRWFFQARVVRHAIRLVFPKVPGWVVFAGSLMVPVYGDKAHAATASENEAIKRSREALAKVPSREHVVEEVVEHAVHHGEHAAKSAPANVATLDTGGLDQPHMKMEIVVLTDTDPESVLGQGTVEAVSFVDEKGVRRIRMGEQLLLVDDLPDTVTFVGVRAGGLPLLQDQEKKVVSEQIDVEAEVRAAQASTRGRPPRLPRAAQPGRGGTGTPRGRKATAAASS